MLRILISVVFLHLSASAVSPELTSYAKVSKNGQFARSSHDTLSWITSSLARNNTNTESEGRNVKDIVITVSPVYVPSRIQKLKKGEAIDYPVVPRYSTLDHEMITKLDGATGKKQIQQRFHPPAIFEPQMNGLKSKPQNGASSASSSENSFSKANSSKFLGPIFSGAYEYGSPEFLNDMPIMSKPVITVEKYPSTGDKSPIAHGMPPNKYHVNDGQEMDYPDFDVASSYANNGPLPKPMLNNHYGHSPLLSLENPYEDDHHFHHDIIYDHVPEYHKPHKEHTTEEPEMNDQRLDKRPYSYYFIGKKLWYVPLYFSIYFVIYIAALVLKSIARHKISLPAHLAEAASHSKRSVPDEGWQNFAERVLGGIERFAETFGEDS